MPMPISEVVRAMLREAQPINIVDVWRLSLDLWWHSCNDTCVVCRTTPCDYKE